MAADLALARKTASRLLELHRIANPPVNAHTIAEAEGISVFYGNFNEYAHKFSGVFDFENRKIFVNREIPKDRKMFTVAHELGHALLHKEYASSENYMAMPYTDDWTQERPDQEIEADEFAASLLVPPRMLEFYARSASVSDLALLFGVPMKVISGRIR